MNKWDMQAQERLAVPIVAVGELLAGISPVYSGESSSAFPESYFFPRSLNPLTPFLSLKE